MEIFTENNIYIYQDKELNSEVFAVVGPHLFKPYKEFDRHTFMDAILTFHKAHGGIYTNEATMNKSGPREKPAIEGIFDNFTGRYIYSSNNICEYALVKAGYKLWKFINKDEANSDEIREEQQEIEQTQIIIDQTFKIEKTIGIGDGHIYVYHYPAYKELALLKNDPNYRCKIGFTIRPDVQDRLAEQLYGNNKTKFPEPPTIDLVINCSIDIASSLETFIHSWLKCNKRKCTDSVGDEWYFTNPEEIESLYLKNF